MPRINPALAIVLGGVLSGALMAQAVPTDPNGISPRPWAQTATDDYPELSAITYETIPGAASDPYNFTHRVAQVRRTGIDEPTLTDLPDDSEPAYPDDPGLDYADPQVVEDDEIIQVDEDEAPKPAIVLSIG